MNSTISPAQAGHGSHHPTPGGAPFPGQPPAHVLPTPVGPGVTQPPDIPDTAKGSPLPHWDGVLVGVVANTGIYVNGAFNYGDFASVEQAMTAVAALTGPADKPAAVVWKDKFGIVHAQALLQYGPGDTAPTALHLTPGEQLFVGHPEALTIMDGAIVHHTNVPSTVPVPGNGGTGWTGKAGAS